MYPNLRLEILELSLVRAIVGRRKLQQKLHLDGLRSFGLRARPEYNGKRHYSLSRMDSDSSNICRAGRSGHQQAVCLIMEMGMTVRIVDVLYNFRGVEQDHDGVRENPNSVDAELFL